MTPTLVLLHGFTQTGASWDRVVTGLGQRYRPLAPDIRGHGAMSALTPVTLKAVIDDVGRLAPARFDLAGYSMGGRLALHVALALPRRVTRLHLIGASPGIADPAHRAQRRADDERLAAEIERSTIETFALRWARTPVLAGLAPQVAAAVTEDRLHNEPAGLARALRGLGTGALPPLWERLDELTMPISLVVGERDDKFRAIAERMVGGLACAELKIVAGAGHAVHLEAPERVAEIIAAA